MTTLKIWIIAVLSYVFGAAVTLFAVFLNLQQKENASIKPESARVYIYPQYVEYKRHNTSSARAYIDSTIIPHGFISAKTLNTALNKICDAVENK